MTFVDFMSLDYEPPALNGNEYDYLFYFAFIRENLYSAASSSDGVSQRQREGERGGGRGGGGEKRRECVCYTCMFLYFFYTADYSKQSSQNMQGK